jgi:diguanylate cyclase (GGDEF)-like protein
MNAASGARLLRPQVPESIIRVLLVEDSDLEAQLLEDRIREARFTDFRVRRVDCLSRAIGALAEEHFDVILLDLTLPDSSGVGTLHRIHDRATATETPIVVITGNSDESMALQAVKIGAQDYLIKGEFGTRALIRTIQNAIERQRMLLELNSAHERERFLATHDPLTELPNRYLFNDRVAQALASARRAANWLAVMFLDLDRFKPINDTLGHSAGDQLLHGVAQRLTACLRKDDSAARISGDEFTILLPSISQALDAAKVAANVRSALARPFRLDGTEIYVTASLGVAIFPSDGEDGETLVKNADAAMYSAKVSGGDNCHFYTSHMNTSSMRHLSLENQLRRAVENDRLQLHYQPTVDGRSGRIVGAEALARWNTEEFGTVPPGEFIPIAEERGLIASLGAWVLRAACEQNRLWRDAGHPPIRIAVNVSPRQFWHTDFREFVARTLEEAGLDGQSLGLEITESCLMHNVDATVDMLSTIKDLGVKLYIDDFGTGYSSLGVLRRLPVDCLKIDQIFVNEAIEDQGASQVATAIIALANNLGLETIGEGVEMPEQREFLLERNCTTMQGYFFARPLPPDDFARLLAAARPLPIGEKTGS